MTLQGSLSKKPCSSRRLYRLCRKEGAWGPAGSFKGLHSEAGKSVAEAEVSCQGLGKNRNWRRVGHEWGFPGGTGGKESACNSGDLRLIPVSGRSPGEENGYPFQYSCLENCMDRRAWCDPKELDVTKQLIFSLSLFKYTQNLNILKKKNLPSTP